MYKNLKQLMDEAQALDYTVGAFNAHNLEMVPSMITIKKNSPSVMSISQRLNTYSPPADSIVAFICVRKQLF